MLRSSSFIGLLALAACDAFSAHEEIVAKAEGRVLTVNRLSEIVALVSNVPIQRGVVDHLAWRWTEYSLFANRAAEGEAFLDSATIRDAMWYSVRRAVIDSFHVLLTDGSVEPTRVQVDSAFNAGNMRLIAHVLRRSTAETTAEVREEQRALAEQIRRGLDDSGSWEEANEFNQDSLARPRNGSLGVMGRGATVPRFENAAYALQPGDISEVVQTEFGFHILYRPPVEDVWDEFAEAVRQQFVMRRDSLYEEELLSAKGVEVLPGAAAGIREAKTDPFRANVSRKVLARFGNETFRVRDFVRWLQVLPVQLAQNIDGASDGQLVQLMRSLVLQELIWRQADSAGIDVTPERFAEIVADYRTRLTRVQNVVLVHPDTLAAHAPLLSRRRELAGLLVDQYLERAVRDPRLMISLPPVLADQLLRDSDWEVRAAGVQRAYERGRQLRSRAAGR